MMVIAARVSNHKDLKREATLLGESREFLRHGSRGIMVEVHDRFLLVILDQGAKALHSGCRWIDIRHADGKGDAARRRRHRCRGQILFVRETWVSMMGVCVD